MALLRELHFGIQPLLLVAELNAALKLFNGEEIKDGTDLGESGYNAIKVEGKVLVGDAAIAITKDNYKDYNL